MHALLVQTIVACFPSTQDGDGHSWAECGCDYVYDQLEAWVEEHPDHWPLAAHISTIVYMLDVYAARHHHCSSAHSLRNGARLRAI